MGELYGKLIIARTRKEIRMRKNIDQLSSNVRAGRKATAGRVRYKGASTDSSRERTGYGEGDHYLRRLKIHKFGNGVLPAKCADHMQRDGGQFLKT